MWKDELVDSGPMVLNSNEKPEKDGNRGLPRLTDWTDITDRTDKKRKMWPVAEMPGSESLLLVSWHRFLLHRPSGPSSPSGPSIAVIPFFLKLSRILICEIVSGMYISLNMNSDCRKDRS